MTVASIASIFGLRLAYPALRFRVEGDPVVDKIDALLPQTQCGQCTFPGCRPYAEAMAKGEADINQCPPGGEATIIALVDFGFTFGYGFCIRPAARKSALAALCLR